MLFIIIIIWGYRVRAGFLFGVLNFYFLKNEVVLGIIKKNGGFYYYIFFYGEGGYRWV